MDDSTPSTPKRGSRRVRRWLIALGGLILLGILFARPLSFELARIWISIRFPEAPSIRTAELAHRMDAPGHRAPLLLDIREAEEYEVSHLPEAINIPPGHSPLTILTNLSREMPVVTYCSMGYRSAIAARQMQSAGFTNVFNLEGSIFRWANEGRSLENAHGPTTKVHPYSSWVSWLVETSHRAPLAP